MSVCITVYTNKPTGIKTSPTALSEPAMAYIKGLGCKGKEKCEGYSGDVPMPAGGAFSFSFHH